MKEEVVGKPIHCDVEYGPGPTAGQIPESLLVYPSRKRAMKKINDSKNEMA